MRETVKAVKRQFNSRLSENSLYNFLNHAAQNDNKSGIISEGPHGGYWLGEDALKRAPALEISEQIEDSQEVEGGSERRVSVKREAPLHERAKQWLTGNSYRAQIISDLRGGATWSNPDVLGIRISKNFGQRCRS